MTHMTLVILFAWYIVGLMGGRVLFLYFGGSEKLEPFEFFLLLMLGVFGLIVAAPAMIMTLYYVFFNREFLKELYEDWQWHRSWGRPTQDCPRLL